MTSQRIGGPAFLGALRNGQKRERTTDNGNGQRNDGNGQMGSGLESAVLTGRSRFET
jgi:hypothetical protein